MARMTPEQEAAYALDFNVGREGLSRAARAEYDRLKVQRAHAIASAPTSATTRTTAPYERTPSSVLLLGALLGWGPWSAAIGAFQAYGDSGYTIYGQSASTSTAHALCEAGQAALQPGICGSIDDHYTFGVAMLVIGAFAFVGGLIGLFLAQQRNPKAWRRAGGPILAGLVFGIFAVVAMIIVAIARGIKEGAAATQTSQAQSGNGTASPQTWNESSEMTTSARQMNVQWRVSSEGGWEWLASDGHWYPQHLAPAGFLPPAPPPPTTRY